MLEKAICKRSFCNTLDKFLNRHKQEFDLVDGESAKNYPVFVNVLQAFPVVKLHSKYVAPTAVIDEAV